MKAHINQLQTCTHAVPVIFWSVHILWIIFPNPCLFPTQPRCAFPASYRMLSEESEISSSATLLPCLNPLTLGLNSFCCLFIYLLIIPRGYRIFTWAPWMSPMSPFGVSHYISLSTLSSGCECVVCTHTSAQAQKHTQLKPTQILQAVWRQRLGLPLLSHHCSRTSAAVSTCARYTWEAFLCCGCCVLDVFFLIIIPVSKMWPSLAAAFPEPCTT